jgi:hypothetical protein
MALHSAVGREAITEYVGWLAATIIANASKKDRSGADVSSSTL